MTAAIAADDTKRLRVVGLSVVFSVCFALACSRWTGSDGRTAAALDGLNVLLFAAYARKSGDRAVRGVLWAAGAFGVVEMAADYLCVHCTGTLDYTVAGSAMLLASPWWMSCSWAVVAVQMSIPGAAAVRRFGPVRGVLLTGLLGSLVIPFYEEMAWGAHWWRYQNCLRIGHTPVYIVLAEAVIGVGLAFMGTHALRARSVRGALVLGAAAGLVTIFGGMIGWGAVEFLGRGVLPLAPWSGASGFSGS